MPRILVTGFSSFPSVPANPTEAMVAALAPRANELDAFGAVRFETLPVEYRALPGRLERLAREFAPEIALHWGVSVQATAFAVETLARNTVCTRKPDNAGHVPVEPFVQAGGGALGSTVPAEGIVRALEARSLPAALSDDAGDYLCNFLFYLSRGGHAPPFAPAQSGFIHVPPFGTPLGDGSGRLFGLEMLVDGALAAVGACAAAWDREKALAG
jgi:pyroglutamyl-peptidase